MRRMTGNSLVMVTHLMVTRREYININEEGFN